MIWLLVMPRASHTQHPAYDLSRVTNIRSQQGRVIHPIRQAQQIRQVQQISIVQRAECSDCFCKAPVQTFLDADRTQQQDQEDQQPRCCSEVVWACSSQTRLHMSVSLEQEVGLRAYLQCL